MCNQNLCLELDRGVMNFTNCLYFQEGACVLASARTFAYKWLDTMTLM